MKRIITISREFGSGGHSIGKAVANRLDIAFYDQNILEELAKQTGFSKDFLKETEEHAAAKNSLLFNMITNTKTEGLHTDSPADTIYFATVKIIQQIADEKPCVIVGRCSDYILKNRDDCIHVFIHADKEFRAKRILEKYGDTEKPILKRLADKDSRRKIYYEHYTDRLWGLAKNFDLALNTSTFDESLCVKTIANLFSKA